MRRTGIVILAVCALFTISAVAGTDTKTARTANATKPAAQQTVFSTVQADSPLVRAAKISLQARMHPKSHIIIDSNTLVVSRWTEASKPASAAAAPTPQDRGRSWQSGNSGDATAIATNERSQVDQAAAAEKARVAGLQQEQAYMAAQEQEPYSEIIDDHVTKRLEQIPAEIKQKPPM